MKENLTIVLVNLSEEVATQVSSTSTTDSQDKLACHLKVKDIEVHFARYFSGGAKCSLISPSSKHFYHMWKNWHENRNRCPCFHHRR